MGEAGEGEADLGVAEALAGFAEHVGGGHAEAVELDDGVAAGEGLVEAVHGAADVGEAEAAVFRGDMGGEQAGAAGQGVEFAAEVVGGSVALLAGVGLEGDHLVANERAGAELQVEQDGKVHSGSSRWGGAGPS